MNFLVKINNVTVEPIKTKQVSKKNIVGFDLFPDLYSNIFLCARKRSGKTSVIIKIINECADENTKIFVFCSTCFKDPSYIELEKILKEKKIKYHYFTSINDGNVPVLQTIIDTLKVEEPEINESDEEEKEDKIINYNDEFDKFSIKIKKKVKKIAPKYIFILDDISNELSDSSVSILLKTGHRHLSAKTIISSQYPNDLKPGDRMQIDYWILFKGHPDKKLEEIYKVADLSIDYNKFLKLYYNATSKDYNFLYINKNSGEFRKNFDSKYIIENNEEF